MTVTIERDLRIANCVAVQVFQPDKQSVSGFTERARQIMEAAESAAARGEGCSTRILWVTLPFMGSAGPSREYSSAVDGLPLAAQLMVD